MWETKCQYARIRSGQREEAFMMDLAFGGEMFDEVRQELAYLVKDGR